MRKRTVILLLTLSLLLACILLTQLQPVLLRAFHAVDGSFGIRPMSHQCAGLRVDGTSLTWLSAGDICFKVGGFSFRYWVEVEPAAGRAYCLGQDVWFGE